MSTHPRFLIFGTTALALVAGLALGASAVLAQEPTGPARSPAAAVGLPQANGSTTSETGAAVGGSSPGSAGATGAIAYPYFGGTPGVAADHTIVVTGNGQADMKSDGSNRAAAQKSALEAALADAKAQAETIASATGLTISGVLSVNASVSPYGVAMPMVAAPDAAPNVPAPGKAVASPEVLGVSVTVAYRVG